MNRRSKRFTLFTPGPVMMQEPIRTAGALPLPYFRTEEFSERMLRAQATLLRLLEAPAGYRVITLTGSGTAAMESVIGSAFGPKEALLVLQGGIFGQRLSEICQFHQRNVQEISIPPGRNFPLELLESYRDRDFQALLTTHHETSTGQLFPLETLSQFCREEGLLFVVDAISSFLSDPLSLKNGEIDALILSSQKGFGLPPGLSFVVLSPRMIHEIEKHRGVSYYLDLKRYLQDGLRGQTPFTPAIGTLLQWETCLKLLTQKGIEAQIQSVQKLAFDFRKKTSGLPFQNFAETPSNAVTALRPTDGRSALWYVDHLREDFNYYVCPNGGDLKDEIFRVGHLGALTVADNSKLVSALKKLSRIKTDRRLAA